MGAHRPVPINCRRRGPLCCPEESEVIHDKVGHFAAQELADCQVEWKREMLSSRDACLAVASSAAAEDGELVKDLIIPGCK